MPGSPDAILIVVANPLDEMTYLAAQESGFPKERVFGMAGVLDSARLRSFISEVTGVSPTKIEAMTLGSHGDAMIALPRQATVDGRPLPELVDEAALQQLFQRTRDGGAEIVGLLKSGSAYYAPSASVVAMVEAVVHDTHATLPVCAWVTGEYGIHDVYVGVPATLGSGGVQRDRRARPQRGRARCAAGSRRRHPSEMRGPGEALVRRSLSTVRGFDRGKRQRSAHHGENASADRDERSGGEVEPDELLELRTHLGGGGLELGQDALDGRILEPRAGRTAMTTTTPIAANQRRSPRSPPSGHDVDATNRLAIKSGEDRDAHREDDLAIGEVDAHVGGGDLVGDADERGAHPGQEGTDAHEQATEAPHEQADELLRGVRRRAGVTSVRSEPDRAGSSDAARMSGAS